MFLVIGERRTPAAPWRRVATATPRQGAATPSLTPTLEVPTSQVGARAGARGSGEARTPRWSRILLTTSGSGSWRAGASDARRRRAAQCACRIRARAPHAPRVASYIQQRALCGEGFTLPVEPWQCASS
jgi:hypothetical protein